MKRLIIKSKIKIKSTKNIIPLIEDSFSLIFLFFAICRGMKIKLYKVETINNKSIIKMNFELGSNEIFFDDIFISEFELEFISKEF